MKNLREAISVKLRVAAVMMAVLVGAQFSAHGRSALPDAVTTTVPSTMDGRPITIFASYEALLSSRTTGLERSAFQKKLDEENLKEYVKQPPSQENLKNWSGAMWAMRLLYRNTNETRRAMRRAFRTYGKLDSDFDREMLETVYATFPREFSREVERAAKVTTSPKQFAMAAHYLMRSMPRVDTRRELLQVMNRKFPDLQAKDDPTTGPHPILTMLRHDLTNSRVREIQKRPPLEPLLSKDFLSSHTVIYSFQRLDRRQPGLALVRGGDGRFVRQPDGTLFNVPHLAMALDNLPGYLTNSNTPQGLFSVLGVDVTRNLFIGTTPFLHTAVPFEVPPDEFFHDAALKGSTWTLEMITSRLPDTTATAKRAAWKDYFSIRETYYAGQAGRTEMLAHGTTADPEPYRGATYFPNTPSLGCMTAQELWSPADGRAMASDQLALVNAFLSTDAGQGFLIVVEIDNADRPVNLLDVRLDVLLSDDAARLSSPQE
ncbi:hypothetical protein CVU37_06470 [candidate division BRC1 bacterium HGW-BRC1-1]|nr:MAG: hypothetical protein CVU37_06470 [candidate division BRC1 bacterium HGW-BRC1-1]